MGQHLAAQRRQAQPQLASNAPATQQTTTIAVSLCDVCHAKPKYFDGTKTHFCCSKTCAAKIQNKTASGRNTLARGKSTSALRAGANMCDYCHMWPRYNDGGTTHSFCSKTCAQQAKAAGGAGGAPVANMCDHCHHKPRYNDGGTTHSFCSKTCAQQAKAARRASIAFFKPLKNGCLLCGDAVKKGHFCSQACASNVEKNAPQLVEVPNAHDTFKSVADQFKASWRHPTTCPTVRRVYKVIGHPTSISKYESYRASVEARGKFAAAGRSPGNENRRWHGTTRECLLGDNGNTTLCSSTSCSLCGIIRTSYSLNHFGKKTGWGRFGSGVYTSSTSSKSNDYSHNVQHSQQKAILLNKVVVGKGHKVTQDNSTLTAPPPGFDSVLAEVGAGGSLNYDELICYTEDAVRPSYLLIYNA